MDIEINLKGIGFDKNITLKVHFSDIVFDIKKKINNEIENKIPIEQIGLYIKDKKNNKTHLRLNHVNVCNVFDNNFTKDKVIYVYDMGKQIDIPTANFIEYCGPIVVFILYLFHFKIENLNTVQKIAILLSCLHYAKRIFESLYIHIHVKTMELKMLFIECIYYIGFYGIFCGYYIFTKIHSDFKTLKHVPLIILFIICEFNNFTCHIILRKIRLINVNEVKIPEGNLFKFVFCANYFWEVGSWVAYSFFTGVIPCFIFAFMGFCVMTIWALEKKKSYISHFGEHINRKAIIPFIL